MKADRVKRMRRRHLNAQRNFGCTLFDIANGGFRYVFTSVFEAMKDTDNIMPNLLILLNNLSTT